MMDRTGGEGLYELSGEEPTGSIVIVGPSVVLPV